MDKQTSLTRLPFVSDWWIPYGKASLFQEDVTRIAIMKGKKHTYKPFCLVADERGKIPSVRKEIKQRFSAS
jgi:hypothetical protein